MYIVISCLSTIPKVSDILFVRTNIVNELGIVIISSFLFFRLKNDPIKLYKNKGCFLNQ